MSEKSSRANESYAQVLKSTSLVGGSEAIAIFLGIIQTKFVAIFIGPLGIGTVGTLQALLTFATRLSGLGIQSSGVREIASAVGSGDPVRVARTTITLRRACWVTGLVGAAAVAALAGPLSEATFGDRAHAPTICALAWLVLVRAIQEGQRTLIQGNRRIADLARIKILGAAGGAAIAIGFYAALGLRGIIPALLSLGIFNLAVTAWFSRRIVLERVRVAWGETFRHSGALVRLGVVLMWSGLLASLVAYLTRLLINREFSLEAVGIFQAAFRLSGFFVGFILAAMATDFYPQLTAVADDDAEMSRLINIQTEVGLLLAGPGLIVTLAAAPLIIPVFYTAEFAPAAGLLRWFVVGCILRVVSWPLGYALVAKGKAALMGLTESLTHIGHIGLIWLGLEWAGLVGVAYAFVAIYVMYAAMMLAVTSQLLGFRWSAKVWQLVGVFGVLTGGTLILGIWLAPWPGALAGGTVGALAGVFSLRGLAKRLGAGHRLVRSLSRLPGSRMLLGTGPEREED